MGAFSHVWEGGKLCGVVAADETLHVPVTLAYALNLGGGEACSNSRGAAPLQLRKVQGQEDLKGGAVRQPLP